MIITVNGQEEEIRENTTLMEYILDKGLEPGTIIVEYNRQVVKQDSYSNIRINESDKIEVLRLVGGG